MKTSILFLALALPLSALPDKPEEDVVYVEEFSDKKITLKVEKPGWIYATKKGGRQRGSMLVGSEAELVSFTDRAYFIRGKRQDGQGTFGWVSPAAFSTPDPDFIEKLKQTHTRQLIVRDLIAKKEVAIGMSEFEASQILGRPTKTTLRRDADGQTQVWEFIEYEKLNHYQTLRDPVTGGFYRQLTHTTNEEKSKTIVEFKNGYVTALEVSENNGPGNPVIVTCPIVFAW